MVQGITTVEPLITDTTNSARGHLRLTDIWPLHQPILLYNYYKHSPRISDRVDNIKIMFY